MSALKTYRIGAADDRSALARRVAPFTCRILSAFRIAETPPRFRAMRASLADAEVSRETYIAEVVGLLQKLPRGFRVHSKLVRDIAEKMGARDEVEAVRVYLLAYLAPHTDAFVALVPKPRDADTQLFHGVCLGIEKEAFSPVTFARLEIVLRELLRLDMHNRVHVVYRILDAPFYIPRGNEHLVLALAHYHPPFVDRVCDIARAFVRPGSLDRVRALVRLDIDLFASALQRSPARGSPATRRFEVALLAGTPDADHPEAGRIAWAFCSVHLNECLHIYRSRWRLAHETLMRLREAAIRGETLTAREAMSPFAPR